MKLKITTFKLIITSFRKTCKNGESDNTKERTTFWLEQKGEDTTKEMKAEKEVERRTKGDE
jgi:hypothetical protein